MISDLQKHTMKTMHSDRLLFGFPVSVDCADIETKAQFAEQYIRSQKLNLKWMRKNGNVVVSSEVSRYADMEWTNLCNARCVFCPRGKMKALGNMEDDVFYRAVDKIRKANIGKIMCIGRGEPLLHPKAMDFVKYIKEHTGLNLEIFTNGAVLTPEMTDALADLNDEILDLRINVSLHTLRHDLHEKMVGVDLRKVIKNLRYLISKKDKLSYSVCFVKNKMNETEMQQLSNYFAKLGIQKTGISLVYNKGGHVDSPEVFDSDFYLRNRGLMPGKQLPEHTLCEYTYDHLAYCINYRGDFTICHDDFDDMYKLGSIFEDEFPAIDAKIDDLKKVGGTEQCKGCTKYLRESFHGKEVMAKNEIVL